MAYRTATSTRTADSGHRFRRRFGTALASGIAALSLAVAPALAQPASDVPATLASANISPQANDQDSPAIPGAGVPAPVASAAKRPAGAPVTSSRITDPIRVTTTSYPFGAANHTRIPENLAAIGYVEEEYFVSGLANVYTWPAPGPAVVRTANAPYTTRILVRRPAKAASFSGNVVVEPLNPSNLFDLNLGWGLMHDQLTRNGDAWVGVTVKPVSIQTLKTFNPVRYKPLAMSNPLSLDDPNNCATVPSDSSRSTENGLAWDIYSQVGQLLRTPSAKSPVHYGGRDPRQPLKLYGFGYSQTGGYMYDYINAVAPRVVQQTGRSIYDAYIVAVAGGAFAGIYPINQCEAVPPLDDPRRQFSNVGVPIIHVMSQSDYLRGITARRPDSDVPTDAYRQYEMAGAGHATPTELNYAAAPADIEKGGRAVPPMDCNEGPRSRFPSQIFFDAMLQNLDEWVRRGIAPPYGSPIVVQNGAPVLDRWGNVVGGLRSPYLDVPTSTWYGSSTGPSFCAIAGHEVPFSQALLRQIYPSHGAYVRAVTKNTNALVKQRFITRYDGERLIREAAAANVP
ncbi:alpha/beta hydrolase domain-containing protein [Tersicoccus phoenicis]|uniref:alpha/beta hydrolase domain-containing protein n=1 Tax=Tersicoccus phoenicis TaxID=554083 RepID=UPI002680B4A2